MLEVDVADDGDFERAGEQVNNDYALARAMRAGKTAGAAGEPNVKLICSRSAARSQF